MFRKLHSKPAAASLQRDPRRRQGLAPPHIGCYAGFVCTSRPQAARRHGRASARAIAFLSAAALCRVGIAGDLRGTVRDEDSGVGIEDATVRLIQGAGVIAETRTQGQGQFTFHNVAQGWCKIAAERAGYLDLAAATAGLGRVLVCGHDLAAVDLRLIRACSVSGRVLDASGRPASGIKVLALARRFAGGGVRLLAEGPPAFSDDRGMYRLYGLPPGRYTVAAVPEGEQEGAVSFAPLYYPGTPNDSQADFFALTSGEARDGADLSLVSAPGFEVKGVVTAVPPDWKDHAAAISIFSNDNRPIQAVRANRGGGFQFHNVPPGSYRVVAWGPIFAWGADGMVATRAGARQGSRTIEVSTSDVTGLEVELRGLNRVDGQLALENGLAPKRSCYAGAEAVLEPLDAMPGSVRLRAPLTPTGFAIPDVPCGRFRLRVQGLSGDCYVKEFRTGGRSAGRAALDIDGDVNVTVILGPAAGVVSGVVAGPDGKAAGAPMTVALANLADGYVAPGDVRILLAGAGGSFRAEHVPPGLYEVLAVKRLNSNDYLDPLFWTETGGVRVTVPPGGSVTVSVRAAQ